MGIGIFPIFKSPVPGAGFDGDGKVLAAEFQILDDLAVRAGVRPFTSFGDNRAVPPGFDGDPDELEELMGEWDEWFSATDGLRTVDALITALGSTAENRDLVEELSELRRCLNAAARAGVEFRLEMA